MPTSISHIGGRARVNEPGRYRKKNNKNLNAQGLPTYIGMPQPLSNLIAKRVKPSQAISKKKEGCTTIIEYPNSFSFKVGDYAPAGVRGFHRFDSLSFGTLVPCGKNSQWSDSAFIIVNFPSAGVGDTQISIQIDGSFGLAADTTYNIKLTNANGDTALFPITTDADGDTGSQNFDYSFPMFNFVVGETIQVDWFATPSIEAITVTTNNTLSGADPNFAGIGKQIQFEVQFDSLVTINNNGSGTVQLPFIIDDPNFGPVTRFATSNQGTGVSIHYFDYTVLATDLGVGGGEGNVIPRQTSDNQQLLLVNSPAILTSVDGTDFAARVLDWSTDPADVIVVKTIRPQAITFEGGAGSESGAINALFVEFGEVNPLSGTASAVDIAQGTAELADFTLSGSLTNNPNLTSVTIVPANNSNYLGLLFALSADLDPTDTPIIECTMDSSTFANAAGTLPEAPWSTQSIAYTYTP